MDKLVDKCGSVLNIREEIGYFKTKSTSARSTESRDALIDRSITYLLRYMQAIVFAAYVRSQSVLPFTPSFTDWWASRRDIQGLFDWVMRCPEAALDIDSQSSFTGLLNGDLGKWDGSTVVLSRSGATLARKTILLSTISTKIDDDDVLSVPG